MIFVWQIKWSTEGTERGFISPKNVNFFSALEKKGIPLYAQWSALWDIVWVCITSSEGLQEIWRAKACSKVGYSGTRWHFSYQLQGLSPNLRRLRMVEKKNLCRHWEVQFAIYGLPLSDLLQAVTFNDHNLQIYLSNTIALMSIWFGICLQKHLSLNKYVLYMASRG